MTGFHASPHHVVARRRSAALSTVLLLTLVTLTSCENSVAGPRTEKNPDRAQAAGADKAAPADDAPDQAAEQADENADERAGETPLRQPEAADKPPFPHRTPAPSLDGGVAWLNTAGPLDVKDLRGKFVLLDFWTYCCINCMHILPELKKLEKAYPEQLVVIGVHSAKFDTEKDSENIREAVLRHEIIHPVVNDAEHLIWKRYGVNSWPSLMVIDPEGYLVAANSGEITFEALDAFLKAKLPYYRKRGLLDETPLRFDLEAHRSRVTPLRFPGKVLADEASKRLFITDSNHNRIVVSDLDGKLQYVIGSGAVGSEDGSFETAQFDHPQGLALRGEMLYVADTENHLIRLVDLKQKQVTTLAGVGHQNRSGWPGMAELRQRMLTDPTAKMPDRWVGPPLKTAINSPWALWLHQDDLYIAMAGPHQIWKMTLDGKEIGPYAGNGREDIVDGPLLPKRPYELGYSSFAQPSGLASDGRWLYVADSEGSSVRAVPFDANGEVKTVVGTSHLPFARLFTFGDVDGQGEPVRLQHVLGVTHYRDKLYIADTYNHKIKVIDPQARTCRTIAGGGGEAEIHFDEPAGVTAAAGKLYVADTNHHEIRVVDLDNNNRVSTLRIDGLQPPDPPEPDKELAFPVALPVEAKAQQVKAVDGEVVLKVKIELPEGWKMNPEAPQQYFVQSQQPGAVDAAALNTMVRLDKPAAEFDIRLPVTRNEGQAPLLVSLQFFYCRSGNEGICKMGGVRWSLPLSWSADAPHSAGELAFEVQ